MPYEKEAAAATYKVKKEQCKYSQYSQTGVTVQGMTSSYIVT